MERLTHRVFAIVGLWALSAVALAAWPKLYDYQGMGQYGVRLEPWNEGDTVTGTLNEGRIVFTTNVVGGPSGGPMLAQAPAAGGGGGAGAHFVKEYTIKYQGEVFAAETNRQAASGLPEVLFRFSSTCVDHGQPVVFEVTATWVFVLSTGTQEVVMPPTTFSLNTHNVVQSWGTDIGTFSLKSEKVSSASVDLLANARESFDNTHLFVPVTVHQSMNRTREQIYSGLEEATVQVALAHGKSGAVLDSGGLGCWFVGSPFFKAGHPTYGTEEYNGINWSVLSKPADGSKRLSLVIYWAGRTLGAGSTAVDGHFPHPPERNEAFCGFEYPLAAFALSREEYESMVQQGGKLPKVQSYIVADHAEAVMEGLQKGLPI